MSTTLHLTTSRTFRRVSAEAIARYAATDAQAARLAGVDGFSFEPRRAPAPLWDDALLDRFVQPLSRLRE